MQDMIKSFDSNSPQVGYLKTSQIFALIFYKRYGSTLYFPATASTDHAASHSFALLEACPFFKVKALMK